MKTSSDYIKDTAREYSIYVCSNRAIPSITDGLKDGQRKALWAIRNKTEKIKTVSLAGEMISSNLFVHGDVSASGAIQMLAGPYVNNVPLIEGIGAFGTRISPYAFGAPRYTYVKKSKFAENSLFVDNEIIPMKENYDGSTMEPVTFLPKIPLVLLNGISGIAVGWSTDILPHSLSDLKTAVVEAIEDKPLTKLVPKFDYLQSITKHIEDNSWEFHGQLKIVDHSTIEITNLPPDFSLEGLRNHLDNLIEKDKIKDYIDESSKDIRVIVKLKRGSTDKLNVDQWIELLKLKTRKTERIVVLDFNGNSIKQYSSAEEVVTEFVKWRFGFYVKRFQRLLNETNEDLSYYEAFLQCFEKELPKKVLGKPNKKAILDEIILIVNDLKSEYVERIANVPIYRWNDEEKEKVKQKIEELKSQKIYYSDLLANDLKIKTIFKKEVMELKG